MYFLKLAENIMDLRKERGITQDELAEFLGITKASVSKWETRQSMPDIMMLPGLAAYFNVSIDELMGYQSQLMPEKIQEIYGKFSKGFSERPYEEVMEESRKFVKQYYSCYPAIFQIGILWLNHCDMAKEPIKVMEEIEELCIHIESHCTDPGICTDSIILRSMVGLMLGRAEEAIRDLEPYYDTERLSEQAEILLIQAYEAAGKHERAEAFNQYVIYKHLLSVVSGSMTHLMYHIQDKEKGTETIKRIGQLITAYQIDKLHPNTVLQFWYISAQFYCTHGMTQQGEAELERFVKESLAFIKGGIRLHGDAYFNRLEQYLKELGVNMQQPRREKTIMDSLVQSLNHPAFTELHGKEKFKKLQNMLEEGAKNYEF